MDHAFRINQITTSIGKEIYKQKTILFYRKSVIMFIRDSFFVV